VGDSLTPGLHAGEFTGESGKHHWVVRPACPDDVLPLSIILPALLPGNWSPEALRSSPYQSRVILLDDQLAGFAEFYQVVDECHLLAIAVNTTCQSRGLGRALLVSVMAEGARTGCTRCLLEVSAANTAAITLYEKLGFIRDGSRPGYYAGNMPGEPAQDALLYSCLLSPLPG